MTPKVAEGMPRRTRIMGQRFAVQPIKDLKVAEVHVSPGALDASGWQHGEPEVFNVQGLCDADAQVIQIETEGIGFDRFRETYLHEHLHAMMALGGLRDTISARDDEVIAKRLAPILLQFLRDNPRVYTFLTGRRLW